MQMPSPTWNSLEPPDARKPTQSASTIEPHQERLGLIIRVMRGQNRFDIDLVMPPAQRLISRCARGTLKVSRTQFDFDDRMGDV